MPGQRNVPVQAFHFQTVFFQVVVFRAYDERYVVAGFLKSGSVIAAERPGSQNGYFMAVKEGVFSWTVYSPWTLPLLSR